MIRHLQDGVLMAYHDRQLDPAEQQVVEAHLGICPDCQARLERLAEDATWTADLLRLQAFEPSAAGRALASFHATIVNQEDVTMLGRLRTSKRAQQLAVSLAALAVLIGLFSLAPVRAFASDLLGIFRVEKFVVVDVDPQRLEQIAQAVDRNMFFGEEEVLQDPGQPIQVASIDEAAALAGFTPRLPQGVGNPTAIEVSGPAQMRFTPDLEALRAVFSAMQLDPMLLPEGIDGQPFTFTVPAGIMLSYASEGRTVALIQVPSPTAEVPEGVDMRALGEAMLQLLGMSPEEAASLSASIDWTTTLVLPVSVSELRSVQEVAVDGATGLLFVGGWVEGEHEGDLTHTSSLLWQKGGVVYMLSGELRGSELVALADTLR